MPIRGMPAVSATTAMVTIASVVLIGSLQRHRTAGASNDCVCVLMPAVDVPRRFRVVETPGGIEISFRRPLKQVLFFAASTAVVAGIGAATSEPVYLTDPITLLGPGLFAFGAMA